MRLPAEGLEMKAVFLTAGAAGMYCGSCMHDNALARALRDQGVDCLLQPVYTPIRTDGQSVAADRIFFGGIHIYLLQQLPWMRWLPATLRRGLDWPPLIQLATRRAQSTNAAKLGELAVSMLRGSGGRQSEEVIRLVNWLADEVRPDAVVFSNLLIGGALPEIRRRLPETRLIVILQGDDIFLDHLSEDARAQCVALCRELVTSLDRVVVNSRFYADKMGALFGIPPEKIVVTPLSIDTKPFAGELVERMPATDHEFRLGYFARIAPEKGFHRLVDTFVQLATQAGNENLTLHASGWLGEANHGYLATQQQKIALAGLQDRFTYHGSPELAEKVQFLRTLDLLSVPTDYEDPKGLFILESLAAGVPVIQPDHGAFGELVAATGGGMVVLPNDVFALAEAVQRLKDDHELRTRLGSIGRATVLANHSIETAAQRMREIMFD